MLGSWSTFDIPNSSTGAFNGDIMLMMTDGSVLIHNGFVTSLGVANQWLRLTPDQNGKYETGTWSAELNMHFARQWFASGVLRDGRVFIIGGEDCSDPANPSDAPTGEIFDPQTDTWSNLAKPSAFDFVRGDCNGAVLADGRVLLGGASTTEPPSTWSKQTAIWDPSDNTWVEAGLEFGALSSVDKEDPFEEETFALLRDGSVLAPAVRDTPKAQRYVPAIDKWVDCAEAPVNLAITTLDGALVYETGGLILLPSGKAFAIGGNGQTAIFTPGPNQTDAGSWTTGPAFPADVSTSPNWPTLTALDAPACLLPSGKVVLIAGNAEPTDDDYFSSNPVFLEYDPGSSETTLPQLDAQPMLPATNQTWQSAFTILPTGQLLCSAQTNKLFIYTPDPSQVPDPAWAPANITVPPVLVLGHSYTLSGTQLNGLSQAVSYGDDAGMATNYPLVRLTNPSTGEVVYVRTHDFSTMGVATGTSVLSDLQSCTIDIPAKLASGSWSLEVVTNGIASAAITVQVAAQDCFINVDNSTFSVGQIDSYVDADPPQTAAFAPAFYVVVEGFTPAEIGIDTHIAIGPQLANPPIKPSVPSPFPGHMEISFSGPMLPQDMSLPPAPQRFTFPFKITFLDDSMFGATVSTAELAATFTAAGTSVSNSASITLTPNPNPFILHGNQTGNPSEPWYLSQDIRVFQLVASPGNTMFGESAETSGTAEQIATTFIQAAVTNLRNNTGNARAEFDAMAQDEPAEILQLLPNDPNTGDPVYNFAIARVRLRDTSNADNVRVFFRIFQAQQTMASYDSTIYARATNAEAQPIPVLGVQGDEIMTIPFFAQTRQKTSQQLHLQQDDFNRHDIDTTSGETDYFFGCWLDINQPNDLRYPQRIVGVSADGPFDTVSPIFPIQQFMVAAHQCLIVEIAYDPDVIPQGADPSNCDKLAQRNLSFTGAPNPGDPGSRRVPQTFEVRPSAPKPPFGAHPDELMIDWENVPAGSTAEVYLPAVNSAEIVELADTLYTSHLLQRADARTLRFPAGGVTYIPIPQGQRVTFAALLTLELPTGIRAGDVYTAIVRQTTSVVAGQKVNDPEVRTNSIEGVRQWRRTTGLFKLTIPVSTKALMLEGEERFYSVMQWVAEAIPTTNRWYQIMKRYLLQLSGRISLMGGDPEKIPASGTGVWKSSPHPHLGAKQECVGKVESLIYDRFGDFDGFVLETMSGEFQRFESREPGIVVLATRAFDERTRIVVIVDPNVPRRPISIVFVLWERGHRYRHRV